MYGHRLSWIGLVSLIAIVASALPSSAGPLQDIPDGLGDALGVSAESAKLILSCLVLIAVGLPLSMKKDSSTLLIGSILLGLVGMLTAIQWIGAWLLVCIIIILALLFGGQMRDWAQSKAG